MAEEVGAIRYTVSAETADMLKAEAVIDKSLAKISKDFDKADAAVKSFEKTQKTMGNTVNKMGQVINKNGDIVEDLTLEYRKLASSASGTFNKLSTTISKSAKGVNKGLASMGRSSGQAGIQFQQFIGQVQGGQSFMVALSQQSADLGFVLGAPLLGAIAGISASLLGMLMPALFASGVKFEDMSESVTTLTTNFELLNDQQKAWATALLATNIIEQEKQLEKTVKKVDELDSAYRKVKRNAEDGNYNILNIFTDKEDVKQARDALLKGQELLVKQQGELAKNKKSIADLNKETKKQTDESKKLTGMLDAQLLSLEQQSKALEDGEESAFRWATAQRLGMKEGELFEASIDKRISAIFRLKKAQEDAATLKTEKKKATSFATGIVSRGMTPEQKLDKEMAQLLRDEELISIEVFEAAKTAIEQKQSALRIKIKEDEAKAAATAQMAMTSAVLGFVSATTGALMQGMDEQSGAYKAMFAIQKASQIAMTISNAHTAQTAAMASTPGPAGIALGSAILAMGYASAGIIAGTAIKGGRQFGGPVSGGSAYRVGEAGPEIYSSGGKNYMIPGENGKVIANDDIGGMGGFTQNVTIENNTSSNVSTSTSDNGKQMRIVINEIANQINSNQGVIPRALRSGTNTKFKANS